MRAVVVYESMYGNTHAAADAICRGLSPAIDVLVVPVEQAHSTLLEGIDLVIVGGPTHVHGMTRRSTRRAAVKAAQSPGSELTLEPGADGPGVREWLDTLGQVDTKAAAFDTRLSGSGLVTGRASRGIAKRLRRHGFEIVVKPESFIVTNDNHLAPGEEARAMEWARQLAAKLILA